jgi:hypothetical protein
MPKGIPKNKSLRKRKSPYQLRKQAMQNLLKMLKELQLAVYLSPKLSITQTDLLIRKFTQIVKNEEFPEYTKTVKTVDGVHYLVDI